MFEINQKTRRLSFACFIDQHAPLRQQRLEPFEHHIYQRFQQRVAGGNEFGLRLTF